MPTTNHHRNSDTHHHHATVTYHSSPKGNPKLLSFFLKFIIMSLVVSLFLIFLGLAAILLLHILLVGSFLHGRRRPPPASSYSLLDLQSHLPPFQFSAAASSSSDCSICLECFKEEEFCRALPECGHVFHAHCVDSWLTRVPSCPVCRKMVRLEGDRPPDPVIGDDDCRFMWAIGVNTRS